MSELLHLDFETRSMLDPKTAGMENYARAAEVLMLGWAIDDAPVKLWVPYEGEQMPTQLGYYLKRRDIKKVAWDARFERTIFRICMMFNIPIEDWIDPQAWARYASMPSGLDKVGQILGLREDQAKVKDGKKLIQLFCKPRKGNFVRPEDKPEEWQLFKDYCCQDVVAERNIMPLLKTFTLPEAEEEVRRIDARINETGMPVDMDFVRRNKSLVVVEKNRVIETMQKLTGLENPNSGKQLLGWLRERDYPFTSLGAAKVERALKGGVSNEVQEVLKLRQQASKSSTAKLDALVNQVSPDGRLRFCYRYYGAARTGRWAGSGPQPHNFPRKPVKIGGLEVDLRNVFRAPKGKKLVVCDLSAIENRGLGWMANCDAILRVFREKLDPYKDFGTRLYHIPYEEVTKQQRQMSKPAVLGCGYGLGGGSEQYDCCFANVADGHRDGCDGDGDVIKTGLWGYAANMGVAMTRDEAHTSVKIFRSAYPEVPRFWREIEDAVITALINPGVGVSCSRVRVGYSDTHKLLTIVLPNKRRLHYINPKMRTGYWPDGSEKLEITYEGLNGLTKQWQREKTYGGKLTENIVQALSRDVLAAGLLKAEATGFEIAGHTHDEIIALADVNGSLGLDQLRECMTAELWWTKDLPLAADGFEDEIYKKD